MKTTLAIESSCDDTCAAVIAGNGSILSNVISSQDEIHARYQGIVPELASRRHCETITVVLKEALSRAEVALKELRAVAVTFGPGLVGSLLTGIAAAKSVHARFRIPLIPVNYLAPHAYSIELEHDIEYPYLSLVASGGHTVLFKVSSPDQYRVLGHTMDDAAGEAYDKVAKMLDLKYPGGPEIERLAQQGTNTIDFPHPTLQGETRWKWSFDGYDFSFSGIKTAVYYHLRDNPSVDREDVAASFQQTVNDVLIYKALKAAESEHCKRIAVGGGVAANENLRKTFRERARIAGRTVYFPSKPLCTDNAAMIGHRALAVDDRADLTLNADPRLSNFTEKTAAGEAIDE